MMVSGHVTDIRGSQRCSNNQLLSHSDSDNLKLCCIYEYNENRGPVEKKRYGNVFGRKTFFLAQKRGPE